MHANDTHGYLLLFRGTDWYRALAPEEIQNVMGKWAGWFSRLTDEGKLIAGQPLENEGVILTGNSRSISDGPFTESKEAVGGYFLLNVPTFEEAVAIGRECPALPHGIIVEVRPLAPACPAERMVDTVSASAVA